MLVQVQTVRARSGPYMTVIHPRYSPRPSSALARLAVIVFPVGVVVATCADRSIRKRRLRTKVHTLLRQGQRLIACRDYDGALAVYDFVIAAAPEQGEAYARRAHP